MPRSARISLAGFPRHIIQRGNNRTDCFYSEQDYLFYLEWLQEYTAEYKCQLHAYVLLTNHIRLLLTPPTQCG